MQAKQILSRAIKIQKETGDIILRIFNITVAISGREVK